MKLLRNAENSLAVAVQPCCRPLLLQAHYQKESMSEKTLIIDGHVHLYPNFDLAQAISAGLLNMDSAKPQREAVKIWLLTERSDCDAFAQLKRLAQVGMYHIVPTVDPEALRIQLGERIVLYILAGRQMVTADGLEICALASSFKAADRELDAAACVKAALDAGSIVSLNWAPGKWFGKRGEIVQALLNQEPQPGLFIGDSAMRPVFWSEPALMRKARARGWHVIAGSDPLPFAGEELSFGRYGCMVTGQWDSDQPVASLHALLKTSLEPLQPWGRRRGALEFFRRQVSIMREKKTRKS